MNKEKTTQYAVLGALSIEPMSGYEIKKLMAQSTNYFWAESNGQLYPTLAALAKAKLVSFENQVKGTKTSKIYTLTKAGEKKLKEWLSKEVNFFSRRDELLLKLFYGANVPPEISLQHLSKHIEDCKAALDIYFEIEKRLEALVKEKKHPIYYLLTVKAGIARAKAELEWSHEVIQLINQWSLSRDA